MRRRTAVMSAVVAIFVVAACGGDESGGMANGEELFSTKILEGQAGCVTCHSLTAGETLVGPSLSRVGLDASQRVSGMGAEEYLEQSIVDPNAQVVEGFEADQMPQVWGEVLDDGEVRALVDYLLTLQG